MLARTAEYLFWAGRYLERAEDTARLLDVTYHRLLEATPAEEAQAWRGVLASVGLEDDYAERGGTLDGSAVSEFLVMDRTNRGSIRTCVEQARLNARGVREHTTMEFWEALNSFHHDLAARDLSFELSVQPSELYRFVRANVQSVLGVADGTWTRDDGWRFFMLGVHLERAEMCARLLRARHPQHRPDEVHEWYATLRATSALNAYRRRYRDLDAVHLIELLMLSNDVPRSVLFSLRHAESILRRLVDPETSAAVRMLGRVRAQLEFTDAVELVGGDVMGVLRLVEEQVRDVGYAVAAECFLYRVELDLHSLRVMPGEVPHDHPVSGVSASAVISPAEEV